MEPVDDEPYQVAFAPPKAIPEAPPAQVWLPDSDLSFTFMRVGLWVVFGLWVLLVLISVPTYIAIAHEDPPFGPDLDPTLQGLLLAAVVDVAYSPPALCGLAANIGFSRKRRWSHAVGVTAYGMLCLCCTPLGAFGLWVLLRERTRRYFYSS